MDKLIVFMRKIVLLFLLMISTSSAFAQVFYSVGSNAEFCAYTFDSEYYLILSFKDDNENRLTYNAVVKFMLNDGTIVVLEGTDGSTKKKSRITNWGFGIITNNTFEKHFAILPITKEQIEQLKIGVDKVVINTIPLPYKRNKWMGKEEFGLSLYNEFMELKGDFEY